METMWPLKRFCRCDPSWREGCTTQCCKGLLRHYQRITVCGFHSSFFLLLPRGGSITCAVASGCPNCFCGRGRELSTQQHPASLGGLSELLCVAGLERLELRGAHGLALLPLTMPTHNLAQRCQHLRALVRDLFGHLTVNALYRHLSNEGNVVSG